MSTVTSKTPSLWQRLLSFMPARTKRLFLIGSLSGSIRDTENLNEETLRKLNELMVLGHRQGAVEFSALLGKVVWDGQVIHDASRVLKEGEVTAQEKEGLIQSIKNSMPQFLRYDDKELEKDLRTLIEHRSDVFGTER